MKETDLYQPICAFLESQGYGVQAEVKHCDIAAVKEGELLIVEMKRNFNLKLVYQALERQSLTEQVYVAIPRPVKGQRERSWQDMLRLLKRLELGLVTVALDSPMQTVEVILEPADSMVRKNRRKQAGLEKEINNRRLTGNVGGITRKKIMTAYRERSIELCCLIESFGQISIRLLRQLGKEDNYGMMLQKNVYHWFERVDKGVYALAPEGKAALLLEEHAKAVAFYRAACRKEGKQ